MNKVLTHGLGYESSQNGSKRGSKSAKESLGEKGSTMSTDVQPSLPKVPIKNHKPSQLTTPQGYPQYSDTVMIPTSYSQNRTNSGYTIKRDIVDVPSFTDQHSGESSYHSSPSDARKLVISLIFGITIMVMLIILLILK